MMEKQPLNMYLTHFGRVQDVQRLEADLVEGVEKFAALGERFDGSENRRQEIEATMMEWLVERARSHGVACSDDDLREVFAGDVVLNTQGIEFWLDHGRERHS
jgi:hypothetical protein